MAFVIAVVLGHFRITKRRKGVWIGYILCKKEEGVHYEFWTMYTMDGNVKSYKPRPGIDVNGDRGGVRPLARYHMTAPVYLFSVIWYNKHF